MCRIRCSRSDFLPSRVLSTGGREFHAMEARKRMERWPYGPGRNRKTRLLVEAPRVATSDWVTSRVREKMSTRRQLTSECTHRNTNINIFLIMICSTLTIPSCCSSEDVQAGMWTWHTAWMGSLERVEIRCRDDMEREGKKAFEVDKWGLHNTNIMRVLRPWWNSFCTSTSTQWLDDIFWLNGQCGWSRKSCCPGPDRGT